MNNFIAAIDFGSQNIRIVVEKDKQIVFTKNYLIPNTYQKVKYEENKYQLIKQGLKRKIADKQSITQNDKQTSYDYFLSAFKHVLNEIIKSINSKRIGAICIVPELYSEVQRHTIKEILLKVGFLSVSFLNYSRVCGACIENENENKITEIVSVGADYSSFSLFKHFNGYLNPLRVESKSGLGGFTFDKILFEQLLADAGINKIGDEELSNEIGKLLRDIEKIKIDVLTKGESKHFAFSIFNDAYNDVVVNTKYVIKCFELFRRELYILESELLNGFIDEKINHVLLCGGTTNIGFIKQYYEDKNISTSRIEDNTVLQKALELGRDDALELLKDAEIKPEEDVEIKKQKEEAKDISSYKWYELAGSKYHQLQQSFVNNDFSKTEEILNEISQLDKILKLQIFFKAASYFYQIDDFDSAYNFIKKTLLIDVDNQIIELFESIVFKEVEKLHYINNQLRIKNLLQDAKKFGVSENIKNAFDKENRKWKVENTSKRSKFTKRKKR